MIAALLGAFSEGLMTTELPAAIAPITGPKVNWNGKLKVLDTAVKHIKSH
jgi:hypothetical protein